MFKVMLYNSAGECIATRREENALECLQWFTNTMMRAGMFQCSRARCTDAEGRTYWTLVAEPL